MEFLLELSIGIIPQLFIDLCGICGLTAKPKKAINFSGEEPGGIYVIARRMADMSPEGQKRMIRFNNISFLMIATGTFGIGILTMILISFMSGWFWTLGFWILGMIAEIIIAVWAYRCWKTKAFKMTEKA